jgi:parallel beta-helix repeat protein
MSVKPFRIVILFIAFGLLAACQASLPVTPTPVTSTPSPVPATHTAAVPSASPTAVALNLSIALGNTNIGNGLSLDTGGDVDTIPVSAGDPPVEARQSGNGAVLFSPDGNTTGDSYFQYKVSDNSLYKGSPTGHLRVEVDYLDKGTDTFSLQYDAQPSGGSNGVFSGGGMVVKTNSDTFKTVSFNVCNAYFANRDNGADFRISDNGDGAETIKAVRVIGLPSGVATWRVDDYGANPMDDQPDSAAIQTVLDSACSGDTIVFTSGVGTTGYQGYLIDKTLFLTGMSSKHDLTFTASDPTNHALLKATADLKGFVSLLYARSRFTPNNDIDNINFGYIDINGGRDVRKCLGSDQVSNGVDDNWGSWLPECSPGSGDPWCMPGNIAFDGFNSGVVVHNLVDAQTECGTALGFSGAGGTIENVTIDTAGDHVHAAGCAYTDNDGDIGGWSDGITMTGPDNKVINNTIINPSDVGIVFFGGTNTIISNNTIKVTAGNYGAFAAIAMHSWILADDSGVQVTGNTITSEGDSNCGGLHVGINLGPHMWGGGCVQTFWTSAVGNPTCSNNPNPSTVAPCIGGVCQIWTELPASGTFTLKDNTVTGAQINYLVEGFLIKGQFIDQNNISITPRQSDWGASRTGCNGVTWGPFDKVAHDPTLPGYTNLEIHCER